MPNTGKTTVNWFLDYNRMDNVYSYSHSNTLF